MSSLSAGEGTGGAGQGCVTWLLPSNAVTTASRYYKQELHLPKTPEKKIFQKQLTKPGRYLLVC